MNSKIMEMFCFIIWFIAIARAEIQSENIESKLKHYFESDVVRSFESQWLKHKASLENAITLAMKESYGHKGMNVYVKRLQDPHMLSKGYYHTDNQAHVLLTNLELRSLPYLLMPEVKISLPSNTLTVVASLSRIIINSNYLVFRNKSDIIYESKDQNQFQNSPFTFQQVSSLGQLAITTEGCKLSVMAITTLNGQSVNLGHNTLKLSKCQYTIEIFKPGMGSPPVIASYFLSGVIEDLLIRPLQGELLPKLQAALFTHVNTTAIFAEDLPQIIQQQEAIFHETSNYINDVVRNMNEKTVELNFGTIEMDEFKISWNDTIDESPIDSLVHLNKMVLTGLETAYSSHAGGLNKDYGAICEQIRFSSLQVRGNIILMGAKAAGYDFAVEISDLAVDLITYVYNYWKDRQQVRAPTFELKVVGWRALEFSIPGEELFPIESLVIGHLLQVIPQYVTKHMSEAFLDARKQRDEDDQKMFTDDEHGTRGSHEENVDSGQISNKDSGETVSPPKEMLSDERINSHESRDSNQGEPVIIHSDDLPPDSSLESKFWKKTTTPIDSDDIDSEAMDKSIEKNALPSDGVHSHNISQSEDASDQVVSIRRGGSKSTVAKKQSIKKKNKGIKHSKPIPHMSDNKIYSDK